MPFPKKYMLIYRTGRLLFYFLIIAVPVVFSNRTRTVIEIKAVIMGLGLTALIFTAVVDRILRPCIPFRMTPLILLILIHSGAVMAVLCRTSMSSVHVEAAMIQFTGPLILILFTHFFIASDIETITALCLVIAATLSIYGIFQYAGMDIVNWHTPEGGRVVSTFGNKNYFSTWLLLMIPMAATTAFSGKNRLLRWAATGGTLIMTVALLLSNSRGAVFIFLFIVLLCGPTEILGGDHSPVKSGKRWKAGALGLVLLICLFSGIPDDIRRNYIRRIENPSVFIGERMTFYRAAVDQIRAYPVTGIGPGNFAFASLENAENRISTHDPNYVAKHVHNDFLEIWVEFGLITFLSYMGIIGLLFFKMIRTGIRPIDTDRRRKLRLITAAAAAYLCYVQISVAGRYPSSVFFFWLVSAMGIVLCTDRGPGDDSERKLRKQAAAALIAGTALAAVIAGKYFMGIYMASMDVKTGYSSLVNGDPESAEIAYERAVSRFPKHVEALYQQGFVRYGLGKNGCGGRKLSEGEIPGAPLCQCRLQPGIVLYAGEEMGPGDTGGARGP